jgi:hypothetical protein
MTCEQNRMLGAELLKITAGLVFDDVKQNGFSRDIAIGYNILLSAALYLETGATGIGNRTEKFFAQI